MEKDLRLLLPAEMCLENTCFFTGHRSLGEAKKRAMYPALVRCILQSRKEGYRYFLNGGALGFDLFCARTIVLLQQEFHMDVHLVLALPCRDQTARWRTDPKGADDLRLYHAVKAGAQAVVYMRDFYQEGCMKERNQFMTEHSSRCIAYWNGSTRGGTGQTIRLAREAEIPIYNAYPAALGAEEELTPMPLEQP